MYYHKFYTVDPFKPQSIEFDVWSEQDVRKLSVAKIHTYIAFDALGYPVPGGPYDSRLGPLKFNSDPCTTCGNNMMKCSGHYGHIELPFPVFNPLFTPIVANILKASCLNCFTFLVPDAEKCVLVTQLQLIDMGCLIEAQKLDFYLEQYDYKQLSQIHSDMVDVLKSGMNYAAGCLCKSADDLWRYYVNKLFRQAKFTKICFKCKNNLIKVKYLRGRLMLDEKDKTFLMPMTAKEYLRNLWRNENNLLKILMKVLIQSDEEYPTDVCFTSVVLVTPSNTRPVQILQQKTVEHPKNTMYRLILQDCLLIRGILQVMNKDESTEAISKEVEAMVTACRGDTINEKLHNAWYSLQVSINSMLDADALKSITSMSTNVMRIGLKQLIEKKAGILRKNMMGKRVDYFARSVVTPDPLLNINEIGVPEAFAKKLTFPVPVTPWNVAELRKMVLNGPQVYPGANIVEGDDGSVVWISATNHEARKSLAKTLLTPRVDAGGPKVVHRHLRNGDMLLINRQPSLHKPSIMAHKARILKGEKTFRLHYANCKAYNADFDGDEINAHFPQSELARAEASEIVNASNQYLVPRDGTPLSGLIQDHVIAGFRLSIRDKFFDRRQYHQMVFQALAFLVEDIRLLPPTILKPRKLWTGKQVISTLIINLTPNGNLPLNTNSKTKVDFNSWPLTQSDCDYMSINERKFMSETNVIIRRGELLCGVVDKNHIGATPYGLVHNFYELYGGEHSANLLSAFSKLFTYYQQTHGFTLGVSDILVRNKPDRKRSKIIAKTKTAGVTAALKALGMPTESKINDEELRKQLEIAYKKSSNFRAVNDREYKTILDQVTNDINKVCLPFGLLCPFPENNLQLMVQSGAKGSTVNTMQISGLLGQIELEGKRPPLMISGKSLPSFRPYDPSPIAGGFIASRFMTGIKPQEFYFHCMAGREGLIDTAVKTSRSGYLQRCLIKLMEGLVVNYDLTVRDTDNSVIQFQYGEDGLDVLKSQLLKPDQLKFFCENVDAFYNKNEVKPLKSDTAIEEIEERKCAIANFKREHGSTLSKSHHRSSAFLNFCKEVADDPPMLQINKTKPGRSLQATNLCHLWHSALHEETKKAYVNMNQRCPNPVMSDYKPDRHFSSVSEKVEEMLEKYIAENKENLPFRKSKLKNVVYWKTFKALVQPGEAVGVLAAQSVGEPSTQMTLNTFHFAGRGEMNVTLGIPRLREILMVAARRIKTPSMEIPFKTDIPKLAKKAEKLRKSLTKVVLRDVLEKIDVKESFIGGQSVRTYELHLHYLPHEAYANVTNLKPSQILNYVEKSFLTQLGQLLKKNLKTNYSSELILGSKSISKNVNEKQNSDEDCEVAVDESRLYNDDSEEDSDGEGDGDATDAKRRSQRIDAQDYDDEEEESDEVPDESTRKNDISELSDFAEDTIDNDDNKDEDMLDNTVNTKQPSYTSGSSDNDNEDSAINLKEILNYSFGSKGKKKGVHVAEKYGIKRVKHDTINMMWTKIVLWVSLSYKRLDLSDLLPVMVGNAVIHEVPGIKRAITYTNSDGLLTLKTEGSYGIGELFKHDNLLDLNKLYSNDVHAVAQTYGIEAANRVIIREVQDVFKVYGINVDPRHLSLIADYMTFDGKYQPLNRMGMDNCPSPLQQMTFESTLKYLKNATVRKLKDNLQSPSSSLIIGQESKIGSGLMNLYCT